MRVVGLRTLQVREAELGALPHATVQNRALVARSIYLCRIRIFYE